MFNIIKAVFGGVILFLGRDMSWLFSLGLGLLVGQKTTSLLPADSAPWMQFILIGALGLIGILPHLVYPESNYIVTGFLFGGYALSEYTNPALDALFGVSLTGSTWMIFFVGAILGATVLAFIKEWGIMLATALVGAFLAADLFTTISPMARTFVAGGLFVVGGIVQALIMSFQESD